MARQTVLRVASVVAIIAAIALGRAASARPQRATERRASVNPVLPGDYPDPSVIRVGGEYWATATTSQWAPIFPLLHSTDLVNWRLVGSVFQKPPAWSAGSYWAPEIVHQAGRFFVYYTARKKEGPLCVAVADAAAPHGPYVDHGPLVCQDAGSIDGAAITDENGQRYLVWKEDGNSRKLPTPLWAQPLSADGLTLVGERREILRNQAPWEAHLIEGPFILRRADWFYVFYSADACCGRRCNYKLGVARARTLLGPWERHPHNPILAGNDRWSCPGHGSIVDTQDGRTFLLYHAYDAVDFEYVGRQGLLDEVTWLADGWPAINGGRGPSRSSSATGQPTPTRPVVDEFRNGMLDPAWQWPWDQPQPPTIDPTAGGRLRLQTSTMEHAVAARPTLTGSYVATTILDLQSLAPGTRAGLAAFGSRENLLAVIAEQIGDRGRPSGQVRVSVWRMQKGEQSTLATDIISASGALHLQLNATDRTRFQFAVSPNGREWKTLADAAGDYLPPWDLAVRVAMLVSGKEASAAFDSYRLEALSGRGRP